ncbi:helix-turn-helix domain-containing protein [Xanthobacteraceae bacterium Astr-EGSB]|uniref:helix-turn-helix domain-containing protein n=1 Tax=Astrobacterium formosum TaxID=3069710 RepID=UPI0027AFF937|nr:helix-turn-helix domain-containing protein [Xanthobacteraceae bacterium Astr-EGSB]
MPCPSAIRHPRAAVVDATLAGFTEEAGPETITLTAVRTAPATENGNESRAARRLGIHRSTLYRCLFGNPGSIRQGIRFAVCGRKAPQERARPRQEAHRDVIAAFDVAALSRASTEIIDDFVRIHTPVMKATLDCNRTSLRPEQHSIEHDDSADEAKLAANGDYCARSAERLHVGGGAR